MAMKRAPWYVDVGISEGTVMPEEAEFSQVLRRVGTWERFSGKGSEVLTWNRRNGSEGLLQLQLVRVRQSSEAAANLLAAFLPHK